MPTQPLHRARSFWAAIGLVGVSFLTWQGWSLASPRPGQDDGTALWISENRMDDGRMLMVVVDQATRHAAVYHLDGAAGTLTLRSTRDLSFDLMVGDFNAQEPRPAALRKMLQPGAAELPR